ncbi:MAG: hypothetical protein OXR67_07355 [Chloroflexota bacterium]|nr:hypothetical protein [Chloroflexota bacterium]
MKSNASMHAEQNSAGLLSRVAHDLSAALDRLTGPAMPERERNERAMAEAQCLKYDTSALHLQ